MNENHCKDCCCARAWDALGIDTYTGRSIPEEINLIRIASAHKDDVIIHLDSEVEILSAEVTKLQRFRDAVVGWREYDWDEWFSPATAEKVAENAKRVSGREGPK